MKPLTLYNSLVSIAIVCCVLKHFRFDRFQYIIHNHHYTIVFIGRIFFFSNCASIRCTRSYRIEWCLTRASPDSLQRHFNVRLRSLMAHFNPVCAVLTPGWLYGWSLGQQLHIFAELLLFSWWLKSENGIRVIWRPLATIECKQRVQRHYFVWRLYGAKGGFCFDVTRQRNLCASANVQQSSDICTIAFIYTRSEKKVIYSISGLLDVIVHAFLWPFIQPILTINWNVSLEIADYEILNWLGELRIWMGITDNKVVKEFNKVESIPRITFKHYIQANGFTGNRGKMNWWNWQMKCKMSGSFK